MACLKIDQRELQSVSYSYFQGGRGRGPEFIERCLLSKESNLVGDEYPTTILISFSC